MKCAVVTFAGLKNGARVFPLYQDEQNKLDLEIRAYREQLKPLYYLFTERLSSPSVKKLFKILFGLVKLKHRDNSGVQRLSSYPQNES